MHRVQQANWPKPRNSAVLFPPTIGMRACGTQELSARTCSEARLATLCMRLLDMHAALCCIPGTAADSWLGGRA